MSSSAVSKVVLVALTLVLLCSVALGQTSCAVSNCVVCYLSDNTKCATCAAGYGRNNNYQCVLPGSTTVTVSHAGGAPGAALVAVGVALLTAAAVAL